MRKIRRQSRVEEVSFNPQPEKVAKKISKPRAEAEISTIPTIENADILAIQAKYENEILKLKTENKLLKEGSKSISLTKNEEKILAAIRSESLIQKTGKPIISYGKFRKTYKVSSDYYRPSINGLEAKGLIKKEEVVFSGMVKTYSWEILEN